MAESNLLFLKLGGSLITDKDRPQTARLDVLQRLAGEIAAACRQQPGLKLVFGHGSGSFGHVTASKYHTRQGVHDRQGWLGFAEVWRSANLLNRLVVDSLAQAGLPVINFPPSAMLMAEDGQPAGWDLTPLQSALQNGLLPVLHGDVVFDQQRGGTILSTEDLFNHLALALQPSRILLAGLESGVWADYPLCQSLLPEITPHCLPAVLPALQGSASVDVTGGMVDKVLQSLALIERLPGLKIQIFSGAQPGAVRNALAGEFPGTTLHYGHTYQPGKGC